jgi:serine/threonine-protein kinase
MQFEDFGPYQLIEKIAEGGMAEIYLARSSKVSGVEKYLVLKRILSKYGHSKRLLELFVNEAKINMNMSHPNVVGIFDFGLINGRFFMAMDFVRGMNMFQILKQVQLYKLDYPSEFDIAYVVSQAAKGLSYAHRCKDMTTNKPLNIIHKDISPDNIMVDLEGAVKVIDFGIAAITTEHTSNGQDGKFSYMSPEQALGLKTDQKTDIFSLGCVLWELLAQRKLYNGKTLDELKNMAENALVTDIREIKPQIHQELVEILDKALKKIPENRYENMSTFQNDLTSFLNKHCPAYNTEKLQELVEVCYHEKNEHLSSLMTTLSKSSFDDHRSDSYRSGANDDATVVSLDEETRSRRERSKPRRVRRKIIRKIKKA